MGPHAHGSPKSNAVCTSCIGTNTTSCTIPSSPSTTEGRWSKSQGSTGEGTSQFQGDMLWVPERHNTVLAAIWGAITEGFLTVTACMDEVCKAINTSSGESAISMACLVATGGHASTRGGCP